MEDRLDSLSDGSPLKILLALPELRVKSREEQSIFMMIFMIMAK
jgi:hypothetical protein